MKLIPIPKDRFNEFRTEVLFSACKWDPCVDDTETLSDHVLVLNRSEADHIINATNEISKETTCAENFLKSKLGNKRDKKLHDKITRDLRLPKFFKKHISKIGTYNKDNHVRLMRFDFHPTTEGFKASEVNSDVPAGFGEAGTLNETALKYIESDLGRKLIAPTDFGKSITHSLLKRVRAGDTIACVHCTSFSDDRQVMQYLGDRLRQHNIDTIYAAADGLRFDGGNAFSILSGHEKPVAAIVRAFPIEWMKDIKHKKFVWHDYLDTTTMSCNHPISIYAQTKRFPIIWNTLESHGLSFSAWRDALPHTICPKNLKRKVDKSEYIIKPAMGRVGEDVAIKGTMPDKKIKQIEKSAKKNPHYYVAQKKFISTAVNDTDGNPFHVCIGAFSIDGQFAGFYGRLSKSARMGRTAIDIAILIEKE